MQKKEILTDIISAAEISVIFTSAVFFIDIISNRYGLLASFVFIAFAAVLYGTALISRSKRSWLIKWAVSIPFSFLVLLYFRITDYSVRSLNWVFPEYGTSSAGGMLASSFLLMIFLAACLISGLAALFIKISDSGRLRKVLFIIISAFAVITVCVVLILERQFPSYEYIMSHM